MTTTLSAPVLSTPAEHLFEEPTAKTVQDSHISEEQLFIQYELDRTIREIRAGRWRRIALQFPDDMLVDAPRVFERLRDGLKTVSRPALETSQFSDEAVVDTPAAEQTRLCILADTSYGACCVDEVAAEHIDADVVVHYGRSCLSPTARLPVIYVFTSKPLDMGAVIASFQNTYINLEEQVCLMADIPYAHHLDELATRLQDLGYSNIFKTDILRDPSSLLPNRTIPDAVKEEPDKLKDYSVFHVSSPPPALLLTLTSRVKSMRIYETATDEGQALQGAIEVSTAQALRRRYALVIRLSTVSIFGILINTLSVANYMEALQHCQDIIARAGKKSYVFVVGKVNASKVANFSEIGGWVVVGCWESSLIESKDFYRPIITPFELEVALTDDQSRIWGDAWTSDFASVLRNKRMVPLEQSDDTKAATAETGNWEDQPSDDEPPEFDLRTGRYVSHTRPMGRPRPQNNSTPASTGQENNSSTSRALAHRTKGELATIGGQFSPAAEYLRGQRTWQGLGSDHDISYERNDDGSIRGAEMQEGRSGLAKGYAVGEDETRT